MFYNDYRFNIYKANGSSRFVYICHSSLDDNCRLFVINGCTNFKLAILIENKKGSVNLAFLFMSDITVVIPVKNESINLRKCISLLNRSRPSSSC